ncbi:hybrid non-ribosomal peptide synthetase/type I polyketide synthase [Aliiglaciecola lipolytica]|uniref:Phenolphthiocerol/phthiocerol polyketide synthase subunit E n=1 Tax=Aliiglaciecola lipolytica E3 TaxID=1127673 RepID=K6WZ20_9ALTE|nr:hybrid non-ribosomal peptide synthetase/type I polyketide synthase [Aliiglaciecola lipolytica]GAC13699.1 phenolpthiocerol synthesis type-I polyketide synthase E [Aliiglaciecola lipolytica E3]
MSEDEERFSGFEIAVVGMACRFPGANNADAFWQNLKNGVESIQRFSQQELIALGHDPEVVKQDNFVPAHGAVDFYNQFDAKFFGYTPREAGVMDPQQRLFLELAWEALEDAGYAPNSMQVPVGIFAGTSTNTYLEANVRKNQKVLAAISDFQANVLNQNDFLSTRASYKLGLSGPSFTLQSACSTSLVATHVACQQLISGSCDVALAGGVSITLPVNWGYQYQEGMIYSPDGHCHAFDENASGTLKGDGGGIVVLKRLADAIEDGDHIEAVILGSAVNNDAQAKVGYTAPGLDGQVEVIQTAMLMADVEADSISNIECHGTGTPMGDPIEIAALTKAFGEDVGKQYCAVGSVKTNIGHLDAGAGVAGLIKTVLALKHKTLPPSLNFKRPNPIIQFEKTPFYVNDKCQPWQVDDFPRRGAVSSFGIGGTNAHIIVEETPDDLIHEQTSNDQKSYLIGWSAQSKSSLDAYTQKLIDTFRAKNGRALQDIAFTLNSGREKFEHRRAFICNSKQHALSILTEEKSPELVTGKCSQEESVITFMFPGQGSQYVNMGRDLYQTEPVFKQHVDTCAQLLLPHLEIDIRKVLFPEQIEQSEPAREQLVQTKITQPALFTVGYALAKLWQSKGITANTVVGHSIGEFAAACIAGVFSLEDALRLVTKRGELMQALPAGNMLSVQLPVVDVKPLLNQELSIAAINSPSLCVVSGPTSALTELANRLKEKGVSAKNLNTSHAFHSQMMEPILPEFEQVLRTCSMQVPSIDIVSTVTGDVIDSSTITSVQYWLDNIRQSVNFAGAAQTLLSNAQRVYLECGPGNTLCSLLRSNAEKPANINCINSFRHPLENINDTLFFNAAHAKLWTCGVDLSSELLPSVGRRVSLPTYAFSRKLCWVEPEAEIQVKQSVATTKGVATNKMPFENWFYSPSWQSQPLSASNSSSVKDESWLLLAEDAEPLKMLVACLEQQSVSNITSHLIAEPTDVNLLASLLNDAPTNKFTNVVVIGSQQNVSDENTSVPTGKPFKNLLSVLQILVTKIDFSELTFNYLCHHACSINSQYTTAPERLMPLGLLRSLRAEYEGVNCKFININESHPNLIRILDECRTNDDSLVVNYEIGRRWVQQLQAAQLAPVQADKSKLKIGGTYLITGGLGAMGLALATYIAEHYQANLILVSRAALPESSTDERVSQQIEAVKKLRARGSKVLVFAGDVANPAAMQKLKQETLTQFGSLNGIFHAAGIPGGGIIAMLQDSTVDEVFSSKVHGTWQLCNTFADQPMDFIVLCSSLTSFIDRPGRAEYAAANYYLDGVANTGGYLHPDLNPSKTPIFSINWDAWTGSAMSQDAKAPSADDRIDSVQGVEAFLRCLQSDWPQIVVSTRNLNPFQQLVEENSIASEIIEPAQDNELDSEKLDPSLTSCQRILMGIWQDLLGVDELSLQDNFFELGGDSIVSLQMTSRAAQQGLKITARQVFENQTIAELAALVEDQLGNVEQEQRASTEPSSHTESAIEEPLSAAELVVGETPLTPIQNWFFANNFSYPNQWNLYYQLSAPEQIDAQQLEQLLQVIVLQHDVLRTHFEQQENGWRQIVEGEEHELAFEHIKFNADDFKHKNWSQLLDEHVAKQSASLQLNGGNLYRFVWLKGESDQSVLVLLVHHLLVDIVSFHILVDDINSAWQNLQANKPMLLPPKTASFQAYSTALQTFAKSDLCQQQAKYWQQYSGLQLLGLPVDYDNGRNLVSSAAEYRVTLDAFTTARITKDLVKQGLQAKDVLLAALVLTLGEFSGQSSMLVELEEHGRDSVDELDVSRTLGWFTKAYPAFFTVGSSQHPIATIQQVRDTAQRASDAGLSFGLSTLQTTQSRLSQEEFARPQVVFLYQGNVLQGERNADFAPISVCQASRHSEQERTHLLEFNVWIEQGQAQISVGYSAHCHQLESIEHLLARYQYFAKLLVAPPAQQTQPKLPVQAVSKPVSSPANTVALSYAQERVWFLEQIEENSTLHNKHSILSIEGKLEPQNLHRAINNVVAIHQSLRTTFAKSHSEPVQVIHDQMSVEMPIDKLSNLNQSDMRKQLQAISESEFNQPFDLQTGPLLRLRLLKVSDDKHFLLITIHHIITDAWSMQLLFKQLDSAYQDICAGRTPLAGLNVTQYADFTQWQREYMHSNAVAESLNFWTTKLTALPTRLELPTDRIRPALQTFVGDKADIHLSASLTAKLRGFCASQSVSVYMTMLAVFKILLSKYSGQTDIVVGTPVANRPKGEFESIIGLLVNNLVLRSDLSSNPTCAEFIKAVRSEVLDANEHANVPFEKVVQAVNPERDRSQSPLFQVMMVFMNAPQAASKSNLGNQSELTMHPQEVHNRISEFDLSLYVYEKGNNAKEDSLSAWFEFNTALFDSHRIQAMAEHYSYLLEQLLEDASQSIQALQLSSPTQQQALIEKWQGPAMPLLDSQQNPIELAQLICQNFTRDSGKAALKCGDEALSYAQLQQATSSLAQQLQSLGVGPEVPVAIYIERSIDMLIAMLAVLRAGGCYVPLDPSFPSDRIAYMLGDSQSKLILTTDSLASTLPENQCEILSRPQWNLEKTSELIPSAVSADNLAYIIYTSGSTGLPKGVRVERHNVSNFLLSMAQQPGLQTSDTFVAVTTISFDIHVLELWLPLLVGAHLVIADKQQTTDGNRLLNLLKETSATAMQATPATWSLLLQCGWNAPLKLKVLCGGEPLTNALCQKLLPLVDSLWNMYGPTETCVWSSVQQINNADAQITIGKPIHNTQFYIVDKNMNLLPPGIVGELIIGGTGVVRDYYKRTELTAKQFVVDPINGIKTGKVYRTGDAAMWRADGNVVISGRMDNQIKLRGYRIELGEIESRLREHALIKDAVVAVRGEAENKRLVSWLIAADEETPSNQTLREFLNVNLPDYMLPAAYIWLPEYPMTPNNKIDRKALIEPVFEEHSAAHDDALQSDAERLVAGVFASVLNMTRVGAYDNFFDLGGHSLLSMKVVDKIEAQTGVRIHPGELFQQTVGQIAGMYENAFQIKKN